jgi:hypothetical protein
MMLAKPWPQPADRTIRSELEMMDGAARQLRSLKDGPPTIAHRFFDTLSCQG